MTKVPVWPVVSMPAKNSAAISGNIWRPVSGAPVRGSRARCSRSANEPRAGGAARMCSSSAWMIACRAEHHFSKQSGNHSHGHTASMADAQWHKTLHTSKARIYLDCGCRLQGFVIPRQKSAEAGRRRHPEARDDEPALANIPVPDPPPTPDLALRMAQQKTHKACSVRQTARLLTSPYQHALHAAALL